jgi:F-type H+-transporting ATPase subunit delta
MEKLTAAHQYARALFQIARRQGIVDRIAAELGLVGEQSRDRPELRAFLFHPEIPLADKRRVLEQILPAELSPTARAFLQLLLEHRQLDLVGEIRQAFLNLRHEHFGVLKAQVETVHPLSATARDQLKAALAAAFGRDVVLVEQTRPDLVAGVRVQVGDRIIDGSAAGRLRRIREKLSQGAR